MAAIKCKQCGCENPEGSTECMVCTAPLIDVAEVTSERRAEEPSKTPEMLRQPVSSEEGDTEYFVICPESQTKTILPHGDMTSFYCEGCKKEHVIDGFLWSIEKKEKEATGAEASEKTCQTQPEEKSDNLWLEEINSRFRIDIDKAGGTLGRYGKYGADFFQSRRLLTVSGEHCMITYEYGNWVLRHISRTNQTKYNNMILGSNEPNLLEDGKVLTLANAVTFIVRIG